MKVAIYEEMQKLAEGTIKCQCGNEDWTLFLYISGGPDNAMAGCKKCGRSYIHTKGGWEKSGGPAPSRSGNLSDVT